VAALLLLLLRPTDGWSGGVAFAPTRRRTRLISASLDGEQPAAPAGSDAGLFADFIVEETEATESAAVETGGTKKDIVAADDDEPDWDEPTGPEDAPGGMTVEPVAKYLPRLMQRKYGDDWELLLADADLKGASGADDASIVDVEAAGYVDEVAHGMRMGPHPQPLVPHTLTLWYTPTPH